MMRVKNGTDEEPGADTGHDDVGGFDEKAFLEHLDPTDGSHELH